MSALPKLTAGLSGVYAAPADTAALRARAAGSDLAWKDVDLARVRSKDELLRAMAGALEFPAHFGGNWDALEDCLGDSEYLPHAGYVMHLTHADLAQRALGEAWDTLLDILRESAAYWKGRKPFVVLVDGAAGLPAWK